MRPTTVVSSANLMKRLELCDGVQSWVSRVKRMGLSTHPWGAPVFSVMVLDVLMQTRTAWGLPVRKSNNQLHRANLWVSCWGMIVLNAELKSMNSILTYESFLSRCVRAGWRAVAMASSVERLDLYANWKGSREGGRTDLMCCMTSRSKHFIGIGVSATGR